MARILIVEDEGILAFKAHMDLEQMGHEVIATVDNGTGAIEITEKEKPDLILMDVVIKGSMNGIEVSEIICQKSDCKIIYMTAHTDLGTLEAAMRTGHAGFLYKPFESFQLQEAIKTSLGT